jgi:hypothetical protein
MHSDKRLKRPASQSRGIKISFRINFKMFSKFDEAENFREFMENFKNNCVMVSQTLLSPIKNKIKNSPSFTLPLLPSLGY